MLVVYLADLHTISRWGLVAAFVVVVSYLAVRAGSFAYFRTRLEYYRALFKELKRGEDRNG